jgi:HPt (histidine-containing phosphotransfer) domain-containing protein
MDQCRRAVDGDDAPTALRSVHTLKSMSGQVGALTLAALAADLEARLRAGATLAAPDFALIQAAHERTLAAVRAHLDVAADAPAPAA